jgi:hypothetical protein
MAQRDPAARRLNVDLVAVLVAVPFSWATNRVGINMVLWLVALVATPEQRPFLRSLQRWFVYFQSRWRRWRGVSGCTLGRTTPRLKAHYETAPVVVPSLSFRALNARQMGIRRLLGFLHTLVPAPG